MLFISIRHLDHWPAPLVRAYAEDCFGERLWVDDEKCKDLVQNLSLIHRHDSNKYNVVQDQYTNELSQRIALRHSRHTDYRSGLERWLQSPALSGLARNLFSLIVKNMKNNYPPLQDDIDTIDSILAMKLKVNQVSSPKSMSYFTIYFDDSYIFML